VDATILGGEKELAILIPLAKRRGGETNNYPGDERRIPPRGGEGIPISYQGKGKSLPSGGKKKGQGKSF